MKSIRQFLLAVGLSILALAASAQTTETTPNLVNNIRGTSGTGVWLGTGGNSQLNGVHPITLWGCCTSYSGSSPFFDTSTTNGNGDSGQIIWSFGNVAVNHIIGINTALANAGTGIHINGYNWRYDVRNMNGGSGQSGVDTLTATSRLWNSTYSTVLLQQSRTHNTTMDWTTFSSTVTAATPHPLANVGNLALEFRASDSGFWNGYYGPQIRDVRASFNYTAAPPDPCVTNPQSSPSCPGYTLMSDNLVPLPNHWTINGQSINQTYAVNQALSSVGAGVVIHGFDYGYQYNLGNSWTQCTATNQDGSCSWTMTFTPRVDVNFKIRSNTNQLLYDVTHNEIGTNTGNRSRDYQYRFTEPRSIGSLGTIGFSATTTTNTALFGMYSRAAYTIDECVADPLSSTTCPGYAQAYLDQQCSANPLYSNQCAGYAQAYFNQQCSNNALYSNQCPGYAEAYFNQQCSNNALYSTACPGYATAYYNYQCSVNPLYHTGCTGYAQAYFNQQCGLNPLYNSACPGYADAYYVQQCGIDPLYDSGCTGYKEAYAKKYILAAPAAAETSAPVQEVVAVVAQAETPKETVATVAVASEAPAASVSPADKTAPVQLTAAPAAAPAAAPVETKRDAAPAASGTRPAASSTRQALAERRAAAAQAASQQAAAEKANSGGMSSQMDSAASMEQQAELQNVVIGAMGFVPGFDAYGRVNLQDAVGYRPFEIYRGQKNIDSPAARGLLGRSDRIHQDMVDSQYNK